MHNLLHGSGSPHLSAEDRAFYETESRRLADRLGKKIAPGDLLVIHDPQPLAVGALLKERLDVQAVWRCHIGLDEETPATRAAADDRLFTSDAGGLTIYQLSADSSRVLYYAHLARYAEGLTEGARVRRGQVLAYVGASGNAPAETPHLHFALWAVDDPADLWDGRPINPHPLLTRPLAQRDSGLVSRRPEP